jgi:hypothetical protein
VRLAALALVALAGCGAEAATDATSRLDVVVRPQGPGGPQRTFTVTCPGGKGCDAPLDPVPGDRACTEIYGGPAVATVKGEHVDAHFNLTNGCEIARWKDASALLGDPPTRP